MDAEEILREATELLSNEEYDQAVALAAKVLAAQPVPSKLHLAWAHKLHGLAAWETERDDEAIAAMQRSVEVLESYATGHYNLACFYAVLRRKAPMLASLALAIRHGRQQYVTDYGKVAAEDPDFDDWRDDPDFLALVDRKPKDPILRPIYVLLEDDAPYEAYRAAEAALELATDKLAVWHAIADALRTITRDLDEHGAPNLVLYGDGRHSIGSFQQLLERARSEIRALEQGGARSDVFRTFKG